MPFAWIALLALFALWEIYHLRRQGYNREVFVFLLLIVLAMASGWYYTLDPFYNGFAAVIMDTLKINY
jgi:1,4-dihydroxy-2-naphthoate octaprenyltransferase